jgi:hypothetical protein
MKPRNQLERKVERWSKQLPPLTLKDHEKAVSQCFTPTAYVKYRTRHFCNMCGHVWEQKVSKQLTTVCPHCGKTLSIEKTRKRKFEEKEFFSVVRVSHGVQCCQVISLKRYYEYGGEIHTYLMPALENWITADDKRVVIARNTLPFSYYMKDPYNYFTEMRIKWPRKNWENYILYTSVNIVKSVLPIFKKHGFSGDFHGFTPAFFFHNILYLPHFETLVKANFWQFAVDMYDSYLLDRYWPQIKICIRHKYEPSDVKIWKDVISNLEELDMDTHNPKYICPDDLLAWHNVLLAKLSKKRTQDEEKKMRFDSYKFNKEKKRYFGVAIFGDNLRIDVLSSIASYYEEAEAMHHCVYRNKYYNKKDSLCLSAKDKSGNRLATIELSLKDFSVLQCRGAYNSVPNRREEIVGLLNKHIKDFRKAQRLAV